MQPVIVPPPLRPGDTIAICSPAGAVDTSLFAPALAQIKQRGYRAKVMPHAMGRCGTYSAPLADRLADFAQAWLDPEVKAVMCARGGYGAMHLLPSLDRLPLREHAKWLIGFSDISALHALMARHGIASVHASMLKGMPHQRTTDMLFSLLQGQQPHYAWSAHPYNRPGKMTGPLLGGNMAVVNALSGTPFDVLRPGITLLIEDINEPIYKIERMMWQMRLSGVLEGLGGLVVGQFTGTQPDANYQHPYDMIADMVAPYSFPVIYDAPIGHIALNEPVLLGADLATQAIDTPWT